MPNIVIVSGGFDPVHKGHLELFEKAAKHGRLCVLINSDEWLMRKKGYIFQPYAEREYLISRLLMVDEVFPVPPEREDVVKGIEQALIFYNNWFENENITFIFANGGDRYSLNTPEVEYCVENGIALMWGLGAKIQSSSKLVEKAREYTGKET